jgi:tRNA pseudouridine32 synthase / 23S rRNA pseudouridine746 synthase
MDTSGVMVFALTPHAQRHLGLQFEKRQMKKTYVARVWGEVVEAARHHRPAARRRLGEPAAPACRPENGRPAQTDWRRVRVEDGTTRMRLYPKTGRSHQLRVHMLEIGHPILGDPFYATGAARELPRLMLHAESLKLRHPDGGKGLLFQAKTPF